MKTTPKVRTNLELVVDRKIFRYHRCFFGNLRTSGLASAHSRKSVTDNAKKCVKTREKQMRMSQSFQGTGTSLLEINFYQIIRQHNFHKI